MLATKLQILPIQLIEKENGILLKRGSTILSVEGKGANDAVRSVVSSLEPPGSTREEITKKFAYSDRPAVDRFIEKLISNHLTVSHESPEVSHHSQENNLDIFYWQFDDSTAQVNQRINSQHIAILGVNFISRQLCAAFRASGIRNFEVVDYPRLRNSRWFKGSDGANPDSWTSATTNLPFPRPYNSWKERSNPESLNCLVATSDFGGQSLFQEWNELCVKNNIPFFPVVLQDQIGYVGPIDIPGETACFECLRARQNSHREDRLTQKLLDESAPEGQSIIGFHPSMASILGDIAALEITKFFSGILPGRNVGTLIEVNLLNTKMESRKVLKVPRCPVCSPLIWKPSTNPQKTFRSN